MARKEDKLRPYRVDYFYIDEMKDNDLALVRSVVHRAVTAQEAIDSVTPHEARIIIRAYRYYKNLGARKKDVFKPVEDLFTVNKAVAVMDQVEAFRAAKIAAPVAAPVPPPPSPTPTAGTTGGHVTRYSDSSLYDEICVNCGATDAQGDKLNQPCPAPTSGPASPATVAVVADLTGMLAHDAHEQTMDTFVAAPGQPDISKYVDKTALPPDHPDHVCTDACYDIVPIDAATVPSLAAQLGLKDAAARDIARRPHWDGCGCETCDVNDPMPGTPNLTGVPLGTKLLLFSGALLIVIALIVKFLHH